jgi:hypothetical protein
MKNTEKSSKETRNLDLLVKKLSEKEVLSVRAMTSIRGGEGETNGGETVITIPKP